MRTRTTLTLDADVVAALNAAQRRTKEPWKQVVNSALRLGLRALEDKKPEVRQRYRTDPVDPGPPALTGVHSVADMLAFAEGEDFR